MGMMYVLGNILPLYFPFIRLPLHLVLAAEGLACP